MRTGGARVVHRALVSHYPHAHHRVLRDRVLPDRVLPDRVLRDRTQRDRLRVNQADQRERQNRTGENKRAACLWVALHIYTGKLLEKILPIPRSCWRRSYLNREVVGEDLIYRTPACVFECQSPIKSVTP